MWQLDSLLVATRLSRRGVFAVFCALALSGCGRLDPRERDEPFGQLLDRAAESFVKLTLAVDRHDPGYVDAYYGPPNWRAEVEANHWSLAAIKEAATALRRELQARAPAADEERLRRRQSYLVRQIAALVTRIDMKAGAKLRFDDEAQALFDIKPPPVSHTELLSLRTTLEQRLPGDGPLAARYAAFRNQFVVPRSALDATITRALEACRERTQAHIPLPEGERVRLEYVAGQPWRAYSRYRGNYESVIQISRDLPLHIDQVLDIGCHEGYPGHHAHNALVDRHLVRERRWVEFSVVPLFSPRSLLAEGVASFGLEVAFSEAERTAFEREVLFPIAGLDTRGAGAYAAVQRLIDRLAVASVEAARRYLDGTLDARGTADWLERYAVMPRPDAMLRFIDQYRAYVIGYTVGRDLVRRYIESRGGTPDQPDKTWEEFERLLVEPRLPSELQAAVSVNPSRSPQSRHERERHKAHFHSTG